MGEVIDLGEAREALSVKRILDSRRKGETSTLATWTTQHSRNGRVVLRVSIDKYELTWPMTIEVARQLVKGIQRSASDAAPYRDVHEGIVHLAWCRPCGRVEWYRTVPARIAGRTPAAVVLHPVPGFPYGLPHQEPHFGWPPAGSYSTETGMHHATRPRRRHWRITKRDLRLMAEAEAAKDKGVQ